MFRKIAINTVISFGARVVGVILGFFVLGITTRALGKEGFGLYSTALSWAYIFSFIADLGLYNFLTKEIAQAPDYKEEYIVGNVFALRAVSLIGALGAGIIVALIVPWNLGVSIGAIAIASVMYAFLSLSQLLMAVFQKHLRMERPALAEIVGRLFVFLVLAVAIYGYHASLNYHIFLLLPALAAIMGFALNVWGMRRLAALAPRIDRTYWKHIVKATLPIGVSIMLTGVYFKLDTLFVAFFRGQVEVGLYTAAYRILENLIFFPAVFVGILMPPLSRFALADKKKFSDFFQGAFDILLIATFPLMIGVSLKAGGIIRLLEGADFAPAAHSLQILAFAIGMIFFSTLFSQALIALGLQKTLLKVYGIAAIANVIANFFIIPRFGYIGASVTTLWTEALVSMVMISILEKYLPLRLRFSRFLPVAFATLVMSAVLVVWQGNVVISIFVAMAVYALCLWAARGISVKEVREIIASERV